MAKKPAKDSSVPDKPDLAAFLQGAIVDQHLDRMAHHAHALQLLMRSDMAGANPSVGACTAKGICTVTILCALTKSPRATCGPTEVLDPHCPNIPKIG